MEINLGVIIFIIIVIIGILKSIPSWIRISKLKKDGIVTIAEIVRIEQSPFDVDDDDWYFQAKVTDEHGKANEICLDHSLKQHYKGYQVGQKVRIRYYPGHLEDFEVLPDETHGTSDENSGS